MPIFLSLSQTSSTQIIKNILFWMEEKANIETRTPKGIFCNFCGLQWATSGYAE
jgi:hypothetical protein